jgi:LysM repeat protein
VAQTERLKVNLVQGENRQQAVIRGQIEIPDVKPDLDQVLSKEVTAKVKDSTVVPDKVIVSGVLSVQVMYVAFVPAQSVHTFEGDVPFTTFVDAPGAEPGGDVHVDIRVEDVSLTPSRKNPRKFDVNAVADVFVKVSEVEEMEILTETPSGNTALETKDITVEHMVGDKTTKQIIVSDVFEEPDEKPEVAKVLKAEATAEVTDTRLIDNKVIVDGEVRLQVLYTGFVPEQSVHDLHHTIPFSNFLDVPDARPGMNVKVSAEVESVDVRPVVDPALSADVIVKLTAFVSETRTLEDVPTRLKNETGYERRKLKLEQQIGTAEKQVVLVSTQAVPEPKPLVTKVIESKVDQIKIVETKILDGKVVVRGTVEVKVVYVSDLPNQAVHALHRSLDFSTFVEIPDASPGMSVEVDVEAEYINVEPRVDNLRLEVVLQVTPTVTNMTQTDVYVLGVTPEPTPTPCPPTEYIVRSGDTLGTIAAAHGTTVEMILEINPDITNPDVLTVGQRILIPCPAMG